MHQSCTVQYPVLAIGTPYMQMVAGTTLQAPAALTLLLYCWPQPIPGTHCSQALSVLAPTNHHVCNNYPLGAGKLCHALLLTNEGTKD